MRRLWTRAQQPYCSASRSVAKAVMACECFGRRQLENL